MSVSIDHERDERYLNILLRRIEICRDYRPKFGQDTRNGLSFQDFKTLYDADPFYAWFGLNHPLIYAAHKAAGGITSIYRQIGIGSEELFRQIIQDQLGLSEQQASWSYESPAVTGRRRMLSLDGRIALEDIAKQAQRETVAYWIERATTQLQTAPQIAGALQGTVFEVRQGYKSRDSKRQNADIANAASAYTQAYLPVLVVLSMQIDETVAERYARGQWLVLTGMPTGDSLISTYAFMREVVGYDLAAFFERQAATLQAIIEDVLQTLLSAE